MKQDLKEIIIAYFQGGNAASGNNKKLSGEIKQDLEAIQSFYQSLDNQQE